MKSVPFDFKVPAIIIQFFSGVNLQFGFFKAVNKAYDREAYSDSWILTPCPISSHSK